MCYYLTAASNRRLVQTSGCKVHKTLNFQGKESISCSTRQTQVRVEPIKKSILFLDDVPTPRPVGRLGHLLSWSCCWSYSSSRSQPNSPSHACLESGMQYQVAREAVGSKSWETRCRGQDQQDKEANSTRTPLSRCKSKSKWKLKQPWHLYLRIWKSGRKYSLGYLRNEVKRYCRSDSR